MHVRKFFIVVLALMIAVSSFSVVMAQQGRNRGNTAGAQPYLGVRYEASDAGAVILEILEGSPAEEAGLQIDDVVTAVNEAAVVGENLARLIRTHAPGDTVTLAVTRGDESLTVDITLGEAPAGMPRMQMLEARPYLGVRLEETDEGVVISEVVEDSPAESIGLQAGDVIQMVNGQEVTTTQEVTDAVISQQPSAQITLTIQRGEETIEFDVVLRALLPQMRFNMMPRDIFNRSFTRPYLGVELNDTDAGVEIVTVAPDSPAAEAGLEAEDIITAIDGETVSVSADVVSTLHGMNIGDELVLTIQRDDETQELTATLGQSIIENLLFREGRGNMNRNMPGMGRGGIILNPGDFTYNEDESVWVVGELAEDNVFYTAGLREGDRITQINGEIYAEDDLDGYNFLFGMEETVTLTVERDGETLELEVDGLILPTLFMGAHMQGMPNSGGRRFDFMPELTPSRPAGARLGVTFTMLDEQNAAEYEVEQTEGALIIDVSPRSPADNAGLQVNDIIVAVDDQLLSTSLTLSDVISIKQPDDVVTLSIIRDGESIEIEATLGQPEQFGFYIPNLPNIRMFPPDISPQASELEPSFSL